MYAEIFRSIVPRPEITARLRLADANIASDVIGVQVRSWRDEAKRHKKYHLPAMKRLRDLMQNADPAARFFVVTDSDEVVAALAEEYGPERILRFPRTTDRNASWAGPEGIIEDFIDMLLLSRTDEMFASYLSTFSETAWWFGGAKARVAVF